MLYCLYGLVLGIHSLISYEGTTIRDLIKDFQGAVDDYLLMCVKDNEKQKALAF